jgi:nicotinate phosphoribosyltransferase
MTSPRTLLITDENLGLATDLYQLTMAAASFANGLTKVRASFEMFVRRLPPRRAFLVAAGLEQGLAYLERLRFPDPAVDVLRRLPALQHVPPAFFDYLRAFRFAGEVYAVPEGTLVFPNEPILRVSGPLPEAQIAETFLLATIGFQSLVASKAARVVQAAAGRPVIEFGSRRAHGPQAGLWGARAAFIGGCAATSNVLAACALGLPAAGTLAHSFILSFDREEDAFRAFARTFPAGPIFLLDTYDTLAAARTCAGLGVPIGGVRLDSGDLAVLAPEVRRILDAAGFPDARIVASNDLNEDRMRDLIAAGAPIDAFGVGTELVTSRDAPALDIVYKLVEVEKEGRRTPRMKWSAGKATLPGRKQVFRARDGEGRFTGDTIGAAGESLPGAPLLEPVFRDGRATGPLCDLQTLQARARDQIARLPEACRIPDGAEPYPVSLSDGLTALTEQLRGRRPD